MHILTLDINSPYLLYIILLPKRSAVADLIVNCLYVYAEECVYYMKDKYKKINGILERINRYCVWIEDCELFLAAKSRQEVNITFIFFVFKSNN